MQADVVEAVVISKISEHDKHKKIAPLGSNFC